MMVDLAIEAERTLGMDPIAAIAHEVPALSAHHDATFEAIAGRAADGDASGDGTEIAPADGQFAIVGGCSFSQCSRSTPRPWCTCMFPPLWKRKKPSQGNAARARDAGYAPCGKPATVIRITSQVSSLCCAMECGLSR